jgi:hypothetical protein|tara:strand:- start:2678 stop:2896 length:219 start_codon:yes stop_codon:yes gene_type:complete
VDFVGALSSLRIIQSYIHFNGFARGCIMRQLANGRMKETIMEVVGQRGQRAGWLVAPSPASGVAVAARVMMV